MESGANEGKLPLSRRRRISDVACKGPLGGMEIASEVESLILIFKSLILIFQVAHRFPDCAELFLA